MLTTKVVFLVIITAILLQRVLEMRLSQQNEARIIAQGGREHAAGHFWVMKLLHATWIFAMGIEVFWLDRPFIPGLAIVGFIGLLVGQSLRYAAILTLGNRWTVRVMTLPNAPAVNEGIYRYVRHPNYLGVILEIAAVPLIHTAYITSIFFTLANGLLLLARIRAEERALSEENNYSQVFAERPRFIPKSEPMA
jgi:methyltransferase